MVISLKIKLFFETILRLKIRQILYRIYYGVSNVSFLKKIKKITYLLSSQIQLKRLNLRYELLDSFFLNGSKNKFFANSPVEKNEKEVFILNFLNKKHVLNTTIWEYESHSTLWNYTLNYMNWLDFFLDEDTKNNNKKNLKISKKILLDWDENKSDISLRSYPTSLRLLSWIKVFTFYKVEDQQLKKSLIFQYVCLKNNIEYDLDANHLLENLISLYASSKFLNIEKDTKNYEMLLLEEINNQFDKNNLHYERSFAYHFSIISRLYLIYFISEDLLKKRIRKILGSSYSILEQFSNKEGVYLFHDATHDMYAQLHQLKSILSPFKNDYDFNLIDSGYFLHTNRAFKLCVDIGNPSPKYQPGHYHCSMSSFVLDYLNNPLIIDTGVYEYYLDDIRRHLSRKTSSHNVMSIDSKEQSNIWSIFRLGESALINNFTLENKQEYELLRVNYTAFPELGNVRCLRLMVINKTFLRIHVVDTVLDKKPHNLKSFLILDPSYNCCQNGDVFFISGNDHKIYLKSKSKVALNRHEVYKRMGKKDLTTKVSIENDNPERAMISYCISDNKEHVDFQVENNFLTFGTERLRII